MRTKIMMNGMAGDAVPVADRGLQYGDGLFETLAVKHGRPLCVDRHLDRLVRGCERLAIPPPDTGLLREEIDEITQSAADLAVLKLIITRGSGARGYAPPLIVEPRRILMLNAWPAYPQSHAEAGVPVGVCETRLSTNPALAGLKHLNRLEQVLARSELTGSELAEGLMLDAAGSVIEGTMSNLFMVQDGQLMTPGLWECGVEGIVRGLILDLAAATDNLLVRIQRINLDALGRAEELFLCNSLLGVWPVTRLNDRRFSVGPVTRYFQNALEQQEAIVVA